MLCQLVLNLLRQHGLVHKRRRSQPLQIRLILRQPIHHDVPRGDRLWISDIILSIVPVVRLRRGVVARTGGNVDGLFSGFPGAFAFPTTTVLFGETVFSGFVLAGTASAAAGACNGGGLRKGQAMSPKIFG